MPDQLRLYIDAEITTEGARHEPGYATTVFGPFRTYAAAEGALTVLMGRENVRAAVIRNPNA